jgi:aminomethyltransferase
MPIQYEGVVAEHVAVRERCGLFDVSHMAELRIRGDEARSAVNALVTNNLLKLAPGAAIYTALCQHNGTVLDDLLVYCLAEDDFMIVANASNRGKVVAWLEEQLPPSVTLEDESDDVALLALQGPRSKDVLASWPAFASQTSLLGELDYYTARQIDVDGVEILLSRTGYSGEWGYELYVPSSAAESIWIALMAAGEAFGIAACGLGARDTLRLEAGYALYGHELDEEATPYESGIGWVVKLKQGDFIGREALAAQKEAGIPRRSVGLLFEGRKIARQGAVVLCEGREVGVVTSGSFSPTLQRGVAMARIASDAVESELTVDIRGKLAAVELVKPPFIETHVRG